MRATARAPRSDRASRPSGWCISSNIDSLALFGALVAEQPVEQGLCHTHDASGIDAAAPHADAGTIRCIRHHVQQPSPIARTTARRNARRQLALLAPPGRARALPALPAHAEHAGHRQSRRLARAARRPGAGTEGARHRQTFRVDRGQDALQVVRRRSASTKRRSAAASTWRRCAAAFPASGRPAAIACPTRTKSRTARLARRGVRDPRAEARDPGRQARDPALHADRQARRSRRASCTAAMRNGVAFDLAPLPHPSGASTWQHVSRARRCCRKALALIAAHPAWKRCRQ